MSSWLVRLHLELQAKLNTSAWFVTEGRLDSIAVFVIDGRLDSGFVFVSDGRLDKCGGLQGV